MKKLVLSSNKLFGTIPSWLGDLNLLILDISFNQFSGQIPDMFAISPNMNYLNLRRNLLTGSIPNSIALLTSLATLDVSDNQLNGTLPTSWIGNLKELLLYSNSLTGYLPRFLPQSIVRIDLSSNSFTGSIPGEWVNCPALKYIFLQKNKLSGTLPTWPSELHALEAIDLGHNIITGPFPEGFCSSSLISIQLSHNKLNGEISTLGFSKCTSVTVFAVSYNYMIGSIPETINSMKQLDKLYLDNNKFNGDLPALVNLQILTTLHLEFNEFSGPIPSFQNQKRLVYFNIENNAFTGSIPDLSLITTLRFFFIQNNAFSGTFINPLSGDAGVGFKQTTLSCKLFPGNAGLCIDNNNYSPPNCDKLELCSKLPSTPQYSNSTFIK